MTESPRLLRAGEHGVLAEFAELREALAARDALENTPIPGVVEVVSGARTLLLSFDPDAASRGSVERAVAALAGRTAATTAAGVAAATGVPAQPDSAHPVVEVPVVYDGEDLAAAAEAAGLTVAELIAEHTGRLWVSAFCGFAPGFSYLISDAPSLGIPRRASPRTRVPEGAVALAGEFSAVYPRTSPGGWQLIGRTSLPMWRPDRSPAAALPAGARVRFVAAEER